MGHQYLFFSISDNIQCGRVLEYIVSGEKCCACYCSSLGLQGGAGVWAIYVLVIHMGTRKVFRRAGHFLAA